VVDVKSPSLYYRVAGSDAGVSRAVRNAEEVRRRGVLVVAGISVWLERFVASLLDGWNRPIRKVLRDSGRLRLR